MDITLITDKDEINRDHATVSPIAGKLSSNDTNSTSLLQLALPKHDSDEVSLSGGTIAGIVIGVIVIILLIIIIICLYFVRILLAALIKALDNAKCECCYCFTCYECYKEPSKQDEYDQVNSEAQLGQKSASRKGGYYSEEDEFL